MLLSEVLVQVVQVFTCGAEELWMSFPILVTMAVQPNSGTVLYLVYLCWPEVQFHDMVITHSRS